MFNKIKAILIPVVLIFVISSTNIQLFASELETNSQMLEELKGKIDEDDYKMVKKLYESAIEYESKGDYIKSENTWGEIEKILDRYSEREIKEKDEFLTYMELIEDEIDKDVYNKIMKSYDEIKKSELNVELKWKEIDEQLLNMGYMPHTQIKKEKQEQISIAIYDYDVETDSFTLKYSDTEVSESEYVTDLKNHKMIMNKTLKIIPNMYDKMIKGFEIITDGKDKALAKVEPVNGSNKNGWIIYIDILDMIDENGEFQAGTFINTATHEFGHILSLNSDQLSSDVCSDSTYKTVEGCSHPDSYLNLFYENFWKNIYAEWGEINALKSEEKIEEKMDEFYLTYHEEFISRYAATNVEEDFAESFMTFITSDIKPWGSTGVDKKINFFYHFPELVRLRSEIRGNIRNLNGVR